jgi:hypothetical protein
MQCWKSVFSLTLLSLCSESRGDIFEISPLDFGSIVVADNNSSQRISINYTGSISSTTGIYIVTPPATGEFLLTNYPSEQQVFITARSIQAQSNSDIYTADQFTLTDVDVPSVITTDPAGSATLYVGGTLETSGSGINSYTNTQYRITYQISVNY